MAQRQLQQLELHDDENRYEEQRSARSRQENLSQREREQRENRQVLNRLRELAQRQADVNERIKELQSALEAAKNAAIAQEIERQLKRLRDQQQQILRDTDELRERMEQEENRERMADARDQIEQGREHVRQASEALEQGQLSQALTEGTRAGRQLNDLREELRKSAANRFTEEATEMREQARRLSDEQQKLSEKLEASNQDAQHSLRDSGERKQVRDGLEQQEKRLDQLMEQMRSTVEDAEESEPLLAKELFDTVRKADEQKIPDALKVSKQLVDLGVSEDAAKVSRQAGQGLDQLREGVERAVKSVLGDETAALKRAESELDDLGEQVDREIADATGAQPPDRNRTGSRPARNDGQDAQARNGRDGAERAGQQDPAQAGRGDRPEQSEQEKSATAQRGSGRQQRQQGENRRGQQGERNGTEQQKEQARGEQRNQQGEQGTRRARQSRRAARRSRRATGQQGRASSRAAGKAGTPSRGGKEAANDRISEEGCASFAAAIRRRVNEGSKRETAARLVEKPAVTTEEAASRTAMAASGAPDERGREGRSGARDSGSGRTGCATWKSCWMIPRCGPRPLGFATACGANERNTSDTRRSPTGTSSSRWSPSRSMSCTSGLPRRFAGASRPMLSCPSIATRFLLSLRRECAATMNGWGVVNEVAGIDLGLAPVDGRGTRSWQLSQGLDYSGATRGPMANDRCERPPGF